LELEIPFHFSICLIPSIVQHSLAQCTRRIYSLPNQFLSIHRMGIFSNLVNTHRLIFPLSLSPISLCAFKGKENWQLTVAFLCFFCSWLLCLFWVGIGTHLTSISILLFPIPIHSLLDNNNKEGYVWMWTVNWRIKSKQKKK
jgi:hypothetical protein